MIRTRQTGRCFLTLFVALCTAVVMGGCATVRTPNPDDPYERFNRTMFTFNDALDKTLLKPVAKGYDTITPQFVHTGVSNFFGNINDVWTGFNNMLQGKVGDGMSDWMRFAFNSTFGLLGVLDIASEAGLEKHDEDFGQTLAAWGAGEGPFLVLPFFGPRTTRDALGLPVDWVGDGVRYVHPAHSRNALIGLRLINTRANALGISKTLEEGTLDKYSFARDFYLQQRRHKVSDGSPSLEYEDFDDPDYVD